MASNKADYRVPGRFRRVRNAGKAAVIVNKIKPGTTTKEEVILPRESFQLPSDAGVGYPYSTHGDYLADLQTNFEELCHSLLSLPELPYNPYPAFVKRLRHYGERFHFLQKSEEEAVPCMEWPVEETGVAHLYRTVETPHLYGLRSILQAVEPGVVGEYRWLVEDVTPPVAQLPADKGHSIQVMMALVGQAVFHGSFYKHPKVVQLRQEFLASGSDVTKAVGLYVSSLLVDLDWMDKKEHHRVLGMTIPMQQSAVPSTETSWTDVLWEMDRIHLEKEEFVRAVSDAVLANKLVTMECVFRLGPTVAIYVRGQKQSSLNFVEIGGPSNEEGLASFAEFPMSTLHEGVFLKKSHAEAYITAYLPQVIGEKRSSVSVLEAASSRSLIATKTKSVRSPAGGHGSVSSRAAVDLRKYVKNTDIQPNKVLLDGFRFGETDTDGPFTWQITAPIKSHWQKCIAHMGLELDFFEVLHLVLLLAIMDRESFPSELLVELSRSLSSTAGRFHCLIQENTAMAAIIGSLSSGADSLTVSRVLTLYKYNVEELFLNKLRECSSDEVTTCHVISAHIDSLLHTEDQVFGSVSHISQTISTLKWLNQYSQTLFLTLVEDLLILCPQLKKFIRGLKDTFNAPGRNATRRTPQHEDSRAGEVFDHGVEDSHIRRHDKWVLNMEICRDQDPAPKAINTDSVLIKYMVDVHLDVVWEDFLVELFSHDFLPPNPYPRLVTALRRAAIKMDLWYEGEQKLISKLTAGSARPTDDFDLVYFIPGCLAHGPFSIMSVLDPEGFFTVTSLAQEFVPKFYIQMKGMFRVAICTAVTGRTALYGRMLPYLNQIVLEEHIYIKGPQGCSHQAIQLCASIVLEQVTGLVKKGRHPILGVYFGKDLNRYSTLDINTRAKGFLSEFESACNNKEPIYLKVYTVQDWRYIPVVKYYKVHYLTENNTDLFFTANPSTFYESVFFEKERAAFHYQNGGPDHEGDPQNATNMRMACDHLDKLITKSVNRKYNFLDIHKLLCLQGMIKKDSGQLVESWRMFHSLAGQVEYVNSLNRSLQDLVQFSLEWTAETGKAGDHRHNTGRATAQTSRKTDEDTNPVNVSTVSRMTEAFREKLERVSSSMAAMTAQSLSSLLDDKMMTVLEKDPHSHQLQLSMKEATISTLEEMRNILSAVSDMVSADVHQTSSLAKAAVERIMGEKDRRSRRILSPRLDNPDKYIQRPQAGVEMDKHDFL